MKFSIYFYITHEQSNWLHFCISQQMKYIKDARTDSKSHTPSSLFSYKNNLFFFSSSIHFPLHALARFPMRYFISIIHNDIGQTFECASAGKTPSALIPSPDVTARFILLAW